MEEDDSKFHTSLTLHEFLHPALNSVGLNLSAEMHSRLKTYLFPSSFRMVHAGLPLHSVCVLLQNNLKSKTRKTVSIVV